MKRFLIFLLLAVFACGCGGVKESGVTEITVWHSWAGKQKELFDKLWARRKKFFEDIVASSIAVYERKIGRKATERELMTRTNKRFIKGWMNRLNSFKFEE